MAEGPLTIAFISDLTERLEAMKALQASEERFRTLSDAALEGVFVHADGRVVLANEAGAAMYGFDAASIVGASLMSLIAPVDRDRVAERIRSGWAEPYEGLARRKDGTVFAAEARGRTLSHQGRPTRVTIIRDITERKRAEAEQRALAERVQQAQKLESLGVLAGGVAHDFNNILTVITNAVTLAKQSKDAGPTTAEHLDVIAVAAARAADLCRQMLAYAGKGALARVALDLSALVAEMSNMLDVSVGERVTLVRELRPDLPRVLGDATQISQVVMNLVLNAAEAIDRPHGTVWISTGSETFDEGRLPRSVAGDEPKPGVYAWVEVRDDGIGMDAKTIADMFDPFFTTKFVGRGLGMAAVLGIVRGHGGAIDVESSLGAGTRIRIFFPASSLETAGAEPSPATAERGEREEKALVLVVDDENNVRESTRLLLEGLGFEVLAARDGTTAIELFRTHSSRIGVVLLDLTMPAMDGIETLAHLRRIAPHVPVVLTSGYGTAPQDGADAILRKPYTAEELLGTLRRLVRTTGS
jgi:PAS domain S-box-containing protein